METEAKYYTPEIEEFRVGFECETLVQGFEEIWSKIILYAEFDKNGWDSNIEDTLIGIDDGFLAVRVKYLDSEDIEELGGIKISDYEYNINGAILEINYSDNTHITISEIRQEWEMTAIPSKTAEYYFPLFMGKIKNKSELKQVLKMIGVH